MATHDRYETDILKQLKRIADSLEIISRNTPRTPRVDIDTSGFASNLLNQQNMEVEE